MELTTDSLLFKRFVTSSGTFHDVGVVDYNAADDFYIDIDGGYSRIGKEAVKSFMDKTPVKSFTIIGIKRVSLDLPEPNHLW